MSYLGDRAAVGPLGATQIQEFERDGILVLCGILTSDELEELRRDADPDRRNRPARTYSQDFEARYRDEVESGRSTDRFRRPS